MSEIRHNILLILASSILYGLYPVASRGAYADGANPVFLILLTTFIRAALMLFMCVLRKKPVFAEKEEFMPMILTGFVQALSIIGIIASLLYLPGPIVVVIIFLNTLMLMFYMWVRKELAVNPFLVLTTIICLIGLCFVVDIWSAKKPDEIIGYALALLGAVATAVRLYLFGKHTKTKNPMVVGAETFTVAFVFLCLLCFYQLPHLPQSIEGTGWSILSGLSLGLAGIAMFYGISRIGAFHFSLYNKLEPVFTSIFSVILIHEVLGSVNISG